jgi:hypothetical protein
MASVLAARFALFYSCCQAITDSAALSIGLLLSLVHNTQHDL